jgi:hypothetical protein
MDDSDKLIIDIRSKVPEDLSRFMKSEMARLRVKEAWLIRKALYEYKARIEAENPQFEVIEGKATKRKKA